MKETKTLEIIRYAVDNVLIINMSAGKYFSLNPEFVAEAVKYAEDKGSLCCFQEMTERHYKHYKLSCEI